MEIKPASDGKIWAYYNITNITSATNLLYQRSDFASYEVDGVTYAISGSGTLNHTFNAVGEHLVKFTPKTAKLTQSCWRSNSNPPILRVYIPDNITSITNATFFNVSSLKGIYGGTKITTLGAEVIRGCRNLSTDIILPSLVQMNSYSIADAFGDVLDLGTIRSLPANNLRSGSGGVHAVCKKIILPSTLESIGNNCMWRVYNLRELIVKATVPPTLGTDCFNSMTDFVIKVPAESVEAYKSAAGWSAYANKISAIPE